MPKSAFVAFAGFTWQLSAGQQCLLVVRCAEQPPQTCSQRHLQIFPVASSRPPAPAPTFLQSKAYFRKQTLNSTEASVGSCRGHGTWRLRECPHLLHTDALRLLLSLLRTFLNYSVLHCFRMLQEQSRQVPGHQGGGGRDGEAESSALMHTVHVCFRRIHATLSCSVTLSGYFLKPFPELRHPHGVRPECSSGMLLASRSYNSHLGLTKCGKSAVPTSVRACCAC